MLLRIKLLNWLLDLMNFKIIKGHRIYNVGVGKSSIIVDLGANKGEFFCEIQKIYSSMCFAVEPNFELFQKLPLDVTRKFHGAISKIEGPVNFYLNYNDEASSLIKDQASYWGNSKVVIVQGISWKKLIENFNLPNQIIDILKIDIEGAELELFESMDENDLKLITQITVEFHDWLNKKLHFQTVKMIQKLIANGFCCFISAPNHNWPVEALFIRKEVLELNYAQQVALKIFTRYSFLKY